MARFFALVQNEYIKIFKKLLTKILLVLLVLSIVGLSLLIWLLQNDNSYHTDYYAQEDYESEISWLNQTKPDNYEFQIEVYQALIDNSVDYDDWRYDAAMQALDLSGSKAEQTLIFIKTNDWKGYCTMMTEYASSESERWLYQYHIDHNIGFDGEYEKASEIIQRVAQAKMQLEFSGTEQSAEKTALENEIAIGLYQLDNQIYENTADYLNNETFELTDNVSFFSIFMMTVPVTIVSTIMIIIAGSIVSSEFHQGTIKFLLINPVSRWKILMSKYFSVISIGYILLAAAFVISIPTIGLIHGFDGINAPYLYVKDGEVCSMNSFVYTAKAYLVSSIEMITITTFAFALSSLTRSAALSIGLSELLVFSASSITQMLSSLGVDWARYLLFANTDLTSISAGSTMFPDQTVGSALLIIGAYMAVFILTAWDSFTKRSV